jgi:hypothetical protein
LDVFPEFPATTAKDIRKKYDEPKGSGKELTKDEQDKLNIPISKNQ